MTTTTPYIGLLRGINVGKAKRMPMAGLKALVESLGYSRVKTLLNSGNVVFHGPPGQAARAARDIEATIPAAFGFSSKLTVLDAAQWAELLCDNPLLDQASDHSRLLVIVWRHAHAREAVLAFARQDWSPDQCATGRHGAYLWCEQGILASRAAVALDKQLRDDVTTRNWATALRIATLLQSPTT
ncbi:DUF1697 domain-containing protein [Ideonella sp. DXS29W]|uniref:DUF1697 domain-containing protein n=1 Tax=Ideonella lacteola TaxID=2984193 RepID=A0ABU9BMI4_9BURK